MRKRARKITIEERGWSGVDREEQGQGEKALMDEGKKKSRQDTLGYEPEHSKCHTNKRQLELHIQHRFLSN